MDEPKYLYLGYYRQGIVRADYGGEKSHSQRMGSGKSSEYQYVTMKKPASMEQAKFEKLAAVNRKGLGQVGGTKSNAGWANAFAEIIRAYPGEASCLENVLDELYYGYARVFWELPDEAVYAFKRDHKATAEVEWLTDEEKELMVRDYVSELKIQTRQILQEAAKTVQREEYREQLRKMKEEMVPILNTQLVFHVQDTGLAAGQTLQDSVYYYDWKNSKENRAIRQQGGNYGDFKVSMQFENAGKPLYFPVDYTGEEANPQKYFPYSWEGCFLPAMPLARDSDVVFSCTLYHYMMMGCPKAMIFTNRKEPGAKQERIKESDDGKPQLRNGIAGWKYF